MPKFHVSATVEVRCERVIEADSEEDAYEIAESSGDDEWLSWAVGPGSVDDIDCWEEKPEPKRKKRKSS